MKTMLFAAAIALGATAAAAQTGNTVNDPNQASGPRGVTQQGTDPEGQACTPAGFNNGASGYAPCGASGSMSGSDGAGAGNGAAGTRPPCSRTVTDGCVQTYERGVRR